MSQNLEYERLSSSQIRLFQVTGHENDAIVSHLRSFEISDAPPYTALSYRWGDTRREQAIVTDGKSLLVTTSLEAFLNEVALRQKAGLATLWYWIDAVSINQEDLAERNHQVRRMKDIYQDAQSIVVWLGAGDAGTIDAIDFLEELAKLECNDPRIEDGTIPGTTCRLGDDESFVEVLYGTLTYDVGNLLQSEYWNRSWIVQEASTPMPRSTDNSTSIHGTSVWCGESSIAWDVLCEANRKLLGASWSNATPELAPLHGVANGDVATLSYVEYQRRIGVPQPLYPMLVRSRASTATDPRDKLYSILGLVEDLSEELQPDYTQPVRQVYLKLAKYLIEATASLDCLGSAGYVKGHSFPSWVPDWASKYSPFPQPFCQSDRTHDSDGSVKHEANLFDTSKGMDPVFSFDAKYHHLIARGFCFDVVNDVSLPRSWPGSDKDRRQTWQNWAELAAPWTLEFHSRCSGSEAFAKVLKADIANVHGDWSAARGAQIEGFPDASVNAFELEDAILNAMTFDRRLLKTAQGYLGLCAATVEKGDQVCVCSASQMPLVLRAEADHWLFIGQAYVHGIMDGEAVQGLNPSQVVDFEIW